MSTGGAFVHMDILTSICLFNLTIKIQEFQQDIRHLTKQLVNQEFWQKL